MEATVILILVLLVGMVVIWRQYRQVSEKCARMGEQYAVLQGKYQKVAERLSPEYRNMLISAEDSCRQIVADAKNQAERLMRDTEAKLLHSRKELDQNRREAERYRRQHCSDDHEYGARLRAVENLLRRPPTSVSLSWLSEQYAEFAEWSLQEVEQKLQWWNRAHRASEIVSMVRQQHRQAIKLLRAYKARARYYEKMFPFLCDLTEGQGNVVPQESLETEQSDGVPPTDNARRWLTDAEYSSKSEVERNQLALERYLRRNKTNWEIGRDFEAFIGHEYARRGYLVEYVGMQEGIEDLGRDLICKRGEETLVIQCKRWAQGRLIHEKHINQLVGTTLEYAQKNGGTLRLGLHTMRFGDGLFGQLIRPVFVTTTELSDTAKQFAASLGVEVAEGVKVGEYPAIKCNISRQDGRKIYHLPFDEQYDSTIIEPDRGESFAHTVQEAVDMGFVRARRHFPCGH